jgi:hypothetical protein
VYAGEAIGCCQRWEFLYIYLIRELVLSPLRKRSANTIQRAIYQVIMLSRSTAMFRSVSKTPVRAFTVSAARTMPARSYVAFFLPFCSLVLTFFWTDGRQMHEADPKALEDEKKKNLSGQQKSPHPEDAPGWNEVLAVSSCFLSPTTTLHFFWGSPSSPVTSRLWCWKLTHHSPSPNPKPSSRPNDPSLNRSRSCRRRLSSTFTPRTEQ